MHELRIVMLLHFAFIVPFSSLCFFPSHFSRLHLLSPAPLERDEAVPASHFAPLPMALLPRGAFRLISVLGPRCVWRSRPPLFSAAERRCRPRPPPRPSLPRSAPLRVPLAHAGPRVASAVPLYIFALRPAWWSCPMLSAQTFAREVLWPRDSGACISCWFTVQEQLPPLQERDICL